MGVQFAIYFFGMIALTATSFLVGNTIGIKPMDLQYMGIASTFIGFGITIARSYIIDGFKLKMGKFRPCIAIMGNADMPHCNTDNRKKKSSDLVQLCKYFSVRTSSSVL